MMKRLYICILLLTMVSTAVIAQDAQQKDDAKKEAKAAKPKKEKAPKAEKAAAKTTVSTKISKKVKKDTPEYDAQIKASIQAMDSVLKNSRKISNEITQDHLMKFADMQCEKFGNDPVFMDKMAEAFYLNFSDVYGAERYASLRKMHPTYIDGFISEAKLFNDLGWKDAPAYDPSKLEAAKALMDSAKIAFPTSTEPYMRWIYWQCPYRWVKKTGYENLSVDAELEAVTKKFPEYPAYLNVAKMYDQELSKKAGLDKDVMISYIVYAGEFYGKANPEKFSRIDIVNYADICDQINSQESLEKGINILNYGIEREPDYPYFYRYKMYINYKLKNWEQVIELGEQLFEKIDTLPILIRDYECLANASVQKKDYHGALDYLKRQLALGTNDNTKQALALRNIIDCYNGLNMIDSAANAYKTFEEFKKSHDMPMTINDYQKIMVTYQSIVTDTLRAKDERINYFYKLDTLLSKMGEVSPENIGYVENTRFNLLYNRLGLEVEDGDKIIARPEILEACERMIKAIKNMQENQAEAEKDENDTYYLMRAYFYTIQHYTNQEGSTGWGKAFEYTEIIMYDMPYYSEFEKLPNVRKNEYARWTSEAERLNSIFKKNGFGKKKK